MWFLAWQTWAPRLRARVLSPNARTASRGLGKPERDAGSGRLIKGDPPSLRLRSFMHQHLPRGELDGTLDLRSHSLRDPLQGFPIGGLRGRLIPKHADHRNLITGYTHEVKGDKARLLAHQGHKALLDVPGDLRLRARG